MNRNCLVSFSLASAAVMLVATSTAYAQGMGGNQSRGRPDTTRMQQQSRVSDGLARREAERSRDQRDAHAADPNEQGSETAIEMRARRDERTQIMEEYRVTREPGQEGRRESEDNDEAPAKKRWWRFWDK